MPRRKYKYRIAAVIRGKKVLLTSKEITRARNRYKRMARSMAKD